MLPPFGFSIGVALTQPGRIWSVTARLGPGTIQAHSEGNVAVGPAKRTDVDEVVTMVLGVMRFAGSLLRGHPSQGHQSGE
jgi:hypothetical protein